MLIGLNVQLLKLSMVNNKSLYNNNKKICYYIFKNNKYLNWIGKCFIYIYMNNNKYSSATIMGIKNVHYF